MYLKFELQNLWIVLKHDIKELISYIDKAVKSDQFPWQCDDFFTIPYIFNVLKILYCSTVWNLIILFFFKLGTDSESFGFGGTGKKSNKRQFDTYGEVNDCFFSSFFFLLKVSIMVKLVMKKEKTLYWMYWYVKKLWYF